MEDTQKMMQRLHTVLQNSMTAASADKKMDSLVVLQFPGLPVDASEFGEDGVPDSLRTMLDTGVNMQAVYQPAGSRLFSLFGQILYNTEVPSGKELSREEKTRLKIAETYLANNQREYQRYYNQYLEIQAAFQAAKNRGERTALQIRMKQINQEWDAHGKQKYNDYSNVVRELHTSSPAAYFRSVLDDYEMYMDADMNLTPSTWYLTQDKLSWTSMEFAADSSEHSASGRTESTNKTIEAFYQSPDVWSTIAGWFGIRRGVTVTTEMNEIVQKANDAFSSSGMRMTWKMMPVFVERPWLDLNVLAVKGAKMAGIAPGAFSSGELSVNNRGTFPGYITAFIVAKDIEMTMTVSSELSEALSRNSSSISCGMLAGGKGTSISVVESREDKKKDTADLTISSGLGKQIIGYIIRPFPRFPSA